MSDWDFIIAPSTVTVDIAMDEVAIPLNSLRMIGTDDLYSGLHEWIIETSHALSEEQRKRNSRATGIAVEFHPQIDAKDFPTFVEALANIDPQQLVETRLSWLRESPNYPGDEAILADRDLYIDYMYDLHREKFERKEKEFDREWFGSDWDELHAPENALTEAVDHLRFMWDTYMKAEWKRVKPIVAQAVEAFRAQDYTGMGAYDAVEAVTGRNMRGKGFFEDRMEKADRLIFMPTAHLGPYISWGKMEEKTLFFFFGVRPPKNAPNRSVDLNRSELLVRLNALADETRLKILELLTEHDEMCAQDFINNLNLSQSSASRHLRQLTASGYLSERRKDVAKCYSLNPDRIDDTIRGLQQFLKKS
ncbi:MAG: metalloregulator ArsR/SmtB family transcription factor [Chloroflexota bacterium]